MPRLAGRCACAGLLAAALLLLWANDSQAQCMSGGRSRMPGGLTGPMMPQQQLMQQLVQQQLFQQQIMQQMLLQQQLTSMVGLRQQPPLQQPLQPPPNGDSNLDEPEELTLSLIALRRQRQENDRLIALDRKKGNANPNPQSGGATRITTTLDERQIADPIRTALHRTQALLVLLGQPNAIAYQTAWVKALEKQSATLTQIGKRNSSDATQ